MNRWIAAIILFLISLVASHYAIFNAWAAGGPPTEFKQDYIARYRFFEICAVSSFFLSVLMCFWAFKKSKNRK
jgi:hypothetical protein